MPRGVDWLKKLAEYFITTKGFEKHLRTVKHLSLSDGNYKAELIVDQAHLNMKGEFHEGLTATLVDVCSSWALLSCGNGFLGVSTNIHVSHFKPAFPGDVLLIDAKVFRIDNPLAFVEVEVSKKNREEIVARGQHTLFVKPITDSENYS